MMECYHASLSLCIMHSELLIIWFEGNFYDHFVENDVTVK